MSSLDGKHYKVRLDSGRVLGPIDLAQIRRLIRKNKITGAERAREHPQGEWVDINSVPEIAELLLLQAEGKLESSEGVSEKEKTYSPLLHGHTRTMLAPTVVLPPPGDAAPKVVEIPVSSQLNEPSEKIEIARASIADSTATPAAPPVEPHEPSESTEMLSRVEEPQATPVETETRHFPGYELASSMPGFEPPAIQSLTHEKTIVLRRDTGAASHSGQPGAGRAEKRKTIIRVAAVGILLGILGHDFLFPTEEPAPTAARKSAFRAVLPKIAADSAVDPSGSLKLFKEASKLYQLDTVPGYLKTAQYLLASISLDASNIRALAMLASTYLNLIDASNKDENYFAVIAKLIEMSRAKNVDLAETVIADVEFYLTVNRPEAAKQRIVEYTRANKNFEPVMYYYVALAFEAKGDTQSAARYISLFPDGDLKLPRAHYFRGRLAETLGDDEAALEHYSKAVALSPSHAKSRLRTIEILYRHSRLKDAAPQLKYIAEHPTLLAPPDLSRAYYLLSRFYQLSQNWDLALASIERALRLDKENTDYLLEFYTLSARIGSAVSGAKANARMYTLMSEGQKLLAEGMVHEAMSKFLEARESAIKSPTPLARLGDLFMRTGDISNARMNYQKATELAPSRVDLWTKYTHSLIESYDWEEAAKAIEKLRKLPISQSAVDKLTGDLAFRQKQYTDALLSYRKAMAHETIDSSVYIAYADTLVEGGLPKDAPFFYALALRFDPLNLRARLGIARAIARSDSIERAIEKLQDDLQMNAGSRAEYLAAIAEFNVQRGEWKQAQFFVDQSKSANPDYAYPWKIQALIDLSRENEDPKAIDRALASYKAYSDRASSDPSGYLERYRLFAKKKKFNEAAEELEKIFVAFPKYPNLHYYKGSLYAVMGNHPLAIQEFQIELKNNAQSPDTMMALGRSYLEVGAPREALEQFQRASILSPNSADPKAMSAYANFLLKNYSAAIALYKSAIALDRGNPLLYKRLGAVYQMMGDAGSAREAFRTYLQMEPDALDRAEIQKFL